MCALINLDTKKQKKEKKIDEFSFSRIKLAELI